MFSQHINHIRDAPAFETAATRLWSEIQLIPGRTIGYLHPKRDVILVRIDAAVMMATDLIEI